MPRERIPNQTGLTIRVPGKVVFLVPWPDHWLIGTTDAPFEGPADRPSAAGWEVDQLLDTVNATMDVDLTRDDVVGTYAGLRPLIAPSDGSTVKASREHRVIGRVERRRPHRRRQVHDLPGHGSRRHRCRARRRGDEASPSDGRPNGASSGRPTPTPRRGSRTSSSTIPAVRASGRSVAARLVARHGTEAPGVVALGAELGLLRPLVPGRAFLEAEVAWAARHELALSLDDVLARRTRLAQELPDRGASIAPRVAAILGAELGWGEARQALEVQSYLASARREYSVPPPGRPEPPRRGPASTTMD